MLKRLLNHKQIVWILGLLLCGSVFAQTVPVDHALVIDHTQVISEQLDLLKTRLQQANNQLRELRARPENKVFFDQVNTELLKQVGLDIAIARSNMDSVSIELTESQQTITRIEKHIQDLENQVNLLNVFSLKFARGHAAPNNGALQNEIIYQKNLVDLEKTRSDYLQKLYTVDDAILQLYQAQYWRVTSILKSRTVVRIKEEQEKSELGLEQQQTYWLQQLNDLYSELNRLESSKQIDKAEVAKVQSEIFFANENVNYSYLQMLISRYQNQIDQYQISIARSTSINLLNKVSEQTQLLDKQLTRVQDLLKTRIDTLSKRKNFLAQNNDMAAKNQANISGLNNLEIQYQDSLTKVEDLNKELSSLHATLERSLQQELSSRQGLPGLGTNAWFDLGQEILWVPTLTFQVVKSLAGKLYSTLQTISLGWGTLLIALEIAWIGLFYFLYVFLARITGDMPGYELSHTNFTWFSLKLLQRNLIDVAVILNIYGLCTLLDIPPPNFYFLIYLGLVWLFFKIILVAARLVLVEAVHNHNVNDMRLYHRLRWILVVGGIITALMVFLYQLPIIYELKDLSERLFLLYVFVISILLVKSWPVFSSLILPYIDRRQIYFKRIVKLVALIIPLILLSNSAIGLFGFVNLVFTIAWYESIFLLVLIAYLIVRGLLIDATERASHLLIRHVTNGWLWTEAFLKPLDKILRIALFLMAWVVLFLFYGWDRQSPVVERLTKLLHYNMISILNTTITPLSVIEVLVIISLLFWAARWTREFVYRFLLSRTKDLGLRNSIAILSQYATIIIGILIILRVLGIDYRTLSVVAGMFFFGVGLGLRDLFNNFACGFLLLIERPIRVGDTVTINDCEGEVVHIGSRAVTIRTVDHMELLVPNAEIFSKSFINWTAKDNVIRTVLDITVRRDDNPHEVQKLIYEVLAANKDVLKDPEPEVFLKHMGEESEFEVRYYVNLRVVKSHSKIRSKVLASIWDSFAEHDIKPPYSHHQILLKNE